MATATFTPADPTQVTISPRVYTVEMGRVGYQGGQGPTGDVSQTGLEDAIGFVVDSNDTVANVNDALATRAAEGGGAVVMKRGEIEWNGRVTVPDSVSFRSQSSSQTAAGTTILLTAAGAGIQWGSDYDVAVSTGINGGFKLDGQGIATNPMIVNLVGGGIFQNIDIVDSDGEGLLLRRTGNCLFEVVNVLDSATDGLQMDGGASANLFLQCNFGKSGQYNANLVSTLGASPFGVDYNLHNDFLTCRFEYHTATTIAGFRQAAGLDNKLTGCIVATLGTPTGAMETLVQVEKPGAPLSAKLRLHACTLQHNYTASGTIGIDAGDVNGVAVILTGNNNFVSSETAMMTHTNGSIIEEGESIFAAVTTERGGAGADALIGASRGSRMDIRRPSGTTACRIGVDGESGFRTVLGPDGSLGFADGTNAVDTFIYRVGASTMGLFGRWYMENYMDIVEMAAPAAPAANTARLFVRDVGGKTELSVLFPSGAIQQIAIEP
jgi:hypothetical protein